MNISNPYAGERRPGSVGFPLPGVSVRASTKPASCGSKVPTSSPDIGSAKMRRALRSWTAGSRPATSPQRSADGYYTLCGRRSDLIISGGFNIYPREIEEFLMEQPEVAEAAVVGEPDRVRGEVPVALSWCCARPSTPDRCEARCREKLASFKVPRRFEAIEKLAPQRAGQGAEASAVSKLMSRILMVTSEAAPFAKTGGLADVLGSLPAALVDAGRRSRRGPAALSRRADSAIRAHLARHAA